MTSQWAPLGTSSPAALMDARIESHLAIQWMARTARAALPARPDDSHMNLGWSAAHCGLVSHAFPTPQGPEQMGFSVADGSLFFARGQDITARHSLDGHTYAAIEAWVFRMATMRGIDPQAIAPAMTWDMPRAEKTRDEAYTMPTSDPALAELGRWFANAHLILCDVEEHWARHITPGPTPPRVWPHHYDMGLLILASDEDPETARSVGVGLSPGDTLFQEPYFYISPYPQPDAGGLPNLEGPAFWHADGPVMAVLLAEEIAQATDQHGTTRDTMQHAISTSLKLIGAT